MRILAMIQGEYGQRHVANIRANGPSHWALTTWTAPRALPPVIDEPEEFVPSALPQADLLLCLPEDGRASQLIPELVLRSGAQAVITAIDREEWLPRGLASQLSRWCEDRHVPAVFPKPLCSLTEQSSGLRAQTVVYHSALISEFARHFGRPSFELACDKDAGVVRSATAVRDACCGCGRTVASRLAGVAVKDAEETAGLAHHHHPCMAGMAVDADFNDTLMHVSGNITKDEVRAALQRCVTCVDPLTAGGEPA